MKKITEILLIVDFVKGILNLIKLEIIVTEHVKTEDQLVTVVKILLHRNEVIFFH